METNWKTVWRFPLTTKGRTKNVSVFITAGSWFLTDNLCLVERDLSPRSLLSKKKKYVHAKTRIQ